MIKYDYKNKQRNIIQNNSYLFSKTLSMFDYSNLPDTIPARELEKLLQQSGYAFITEFNGALYAFTGSLGGLPDEYLNPTEITINNVYLNFNKTLSIRDDGVLIRNDDMQLGLLPLFTKYNTLMVENDINIMVQGYNSRIQKMISASDDKTEQSARIYLEKVIDGEIGVIGESALFDGVKLHTIQGGQGGSLTAMIELQQYLRGTLFNEVGLNANFNMKRERLTGGEIEANDDVLFPFVDNMLLCREQGLQSLNEKYGLGVSVRFGSIWAQKELEVKHDDLELGADDETQSELEIDFNEVISGGVGDSDEEEMTDETEPDDSIEGAEDESEAEPDDESETEPDESEAEPDESEAEPDESEAEPDDESETEPDESEAEPDESEAEPDDESEPNDDESEPNDDESEPNDDESGTNDDESGANDDESEDDESDEEKRK